MSLPLCLPGSMPVDLTFAPGRAFPIQPNQNCLIQFGYNPMFMHAVGLLLRLSMQVMTLPSIHVDVYLGNSGSSGGPLISSWTLGQDMNHINCIATTSNFSVELFVDSTIFSETPEFVLDVGPISNYSTENVIFSEVSQNPYTLTVPRAIEVSSYLERLIIACPDCVIEFTPKTDEFNIVKIFDGPNLNSPELAQFGDGTTAPSGRIISTGNLMFIQVANFGSLAASDTVIAGNITEIVDEIVCSSGEVRAYLTEELLTQMEVQPNDDTVASDVEVEDNSAVETMCRPVTQNSFLHYYRFNITDCGATSVKNETHETFTYLFWKISNHQVSNILQRFTESCLTLSCTFEIEQNVTSDYVAPDLGKVDLLIEAQDANYEFNYKFYYNDSFSVSIPASDYNVSVPDFVYFTLNITNNLNIEACICWATPDAVLTNPVQYMILDDSCPTGETFDGEPATRLYANGNTSTVQVGFRSFRWNRLVKRHEFINGTGPPSPIYIHCSVRICDNAAEALFCDEVECVNGRSGRSVDGRSTQIFSSEGIFINSYSEQRRMDACEINNGGCSEGCFTDNYNDPICYCFGGRVVNPDGTCSDFQDRVLNQKEEQTITKYLLFDLIIIVIVFIAITFMIISYLKGRRNDFTKI